MLQKLIVYNPIFVVMEAYKIFCRDNHTKNGISVLTVAGTCKESIIQWWNETGRNNILPILSIQADYTVKLNEWEAYA